MQYGFREDRIERGLAERKLEDISLKKVSAFDGAQALLRDIGAGRNVSANPVTPAPRRIHPKRGAEAAATSGIKNSTPAAEECAHGIYRVEAVPLDQPGLGTRMHCRRIVDRKSTRLNSSHIQKSRMPSSA